MADQRRGKPWTAEEDDQLRREHASGISLLDIMAAHGRTGGGITSRLKRLGLVENEQDIPDYLGHDTFAEISAKILLDYKEKNMSVSELAVLHNKSELFVTKAITPKAITPKVELPKLPKLPKIADDGCAVVNFEDALYDTPMRPKKATADDAHAFMQTVLRDLEEIKYVTDITDIKVRIATYLATYA